MSSANEYRVIAQDCLRMAVDAEDERDRPLWVTMAQSWIQLAEHVSRHSHETAAEGTEGETDDSGDNSTPGSDPDWSQTPN